MSGGLRTSVKGYLIAQRLNSATDPLSENETISNNVTAPLDPPLQPVEEKTMDSGTYGLGICDGNISNIPCVPMLNSAKSMASYMTRTRAESHPPQGVRSFRFNDLKTATCNFHPNRLLGEGGFGSVYKGWIDEHSFTAAEPGTGMAIAITRLNEQSTLQSPKERITEVNYLGQLVHPNIVKLIGYCLKDDRQLLVSECMPDGGLERHLFREASYLQPLSWMHRIKIAIGAAKGLAFLHSDEAKVIHGNFKSSKILLDSNYNAKLYGYGVSGEQLLDSYRHALHDALILDYESPWYVPPVWEYVAPEVKNTGIPSSLTALLYCLTAKSDVYSFGVVMLELLSGRRARDLRRPRKEQSLVEWAKPYLVNPRKRRVLQIFDASIDGQYSVAAARRAAKIVYLCLATETEYRPIMSDVVKALERLQKREEAGPSQNEPRQNLHASSITVPEIEGEV
ncbi:PREDICTED: probable serine/threonine-protein kinase NAK [Fragaria vesca subsp. vesca]|uniref:probable serine/threonine-protein kinase NAK n=1 Tax=Fragaria vesca subsp. vesca TaxID=101020 RepID=UPI0002C338A9|nr:PREDICTED: probable serine/threonine-protein kinase NAK [Fragaria vesca subsp. vesca]XP_011469762.1 PREDICTED: probable serine/threonine-protein kinase NAK [Fragaria vesca subsp. vesca]